jgi:hypothetical protein
VNIINPAPQSVAAPQSLTTLRFFLKLLKVANMIKVSRLFSLVCFSNHYKKNLHQSTKSLPQIAAADPRIGTLFFTTNTERPAEAPEAASKKRVPIEGYSG